MWVYRHVSHFFPQNVGLPKWSSTEIRNQDVHTNGLVLDDTILADPEVNTTAENHVSLLVDWLCSADMTFDSLPKSIAF